MVLFYIFMLQQSILPPKMSSDGRDFLRMTFEKKDVPENGQSGQISQPRHSSIIFREKFEGGLK